MNNDQTESRIEEAQDEAMESIPIVGAAVGASINGWSVKEAGWLTRSLYSESGLTEHE